MSLVSMAQLRTRGRIVSLWLVPIAIVVLTLMLDQLLRRQVYRPIASLRDTMTRAGGGDRSARAPIERMDEMGALATGLNQMLDQLADFNRALEERIFDVTGELDRTHAERIQDYQRMLELREALAEAERMAAVGQTTASVAHQVGTPLNLISGHVQVLLSKPDLTPDWERRLRLVQEQIARVADVGARPARTLATAGTGVADRSGRAARVDCRSDPPPADGVQAFAWSRTWTMACRRSSARATNWKWRCSISSATPSTPCPPVATSSLAPAWTGEAVRITVAGFWPRYCTGPVAPHLRAVRDDQGARTGHRARAEHHA